VLRNLCKLLIIQFSLSIALANASELTSRMIATPVNQMDLFLMKSNLAIKDFFPADFVFEVEGNDYLWKNNYGVGFDLDDDIFIVTNSLWISDQAIQKRIDATRLCLEVLERLVKFELSFADVGGGSYFKTGGGVEYGIDVFEIGDILNSKTMYRVKWISQIVNPEKSVMCEVAHGESIRSAKTESIGDWK